MSNPIIQILRRAKDGQDIYPVTVTDAVKCEDGTDLTTTLDNKQDRITTSQLNVDEDILTIDLIY